MRALIPQWSAILIFPLKFYLMHWCTRTIFLIIRYGSQKYFNGSFEGLRKHQLQDRRNQPQRTFTGIIFGNGRSKFSMQVKKNFRVGSCQLPTLILQYPDSDHTGVGREMCNTQLCTACTWYLVVCMAKEVLLTWKISIVQPDYLRNFGSSSAVFILMSDFIFCA